MAVYGDLALRQYQDLHLVVRTEHLLKAVDLFTRRGFRLAQYSYLPNNWRNLGRQHEVTLQAPDKTYFVDLHWQLAPDHARAFSLDVEKLWDRTEKLELPHGNVSTLCRGDLFLALCCHGTVHRWSRLKWLLDVAEILCQPERLNWARIKEMTVGRPAAIASASLAILLARDLLGVPVPAEAENSLPATQRTRNVAADIGNEILLRGQTSGNNHTAARIGWWRTSVVEILRHPVSWVVLPSRSRSDLSQGSRRGASPGKTPVSLPLHQAGAFGR